MIALAQAPVSSPSSISSISTSPSLREKRKEWDFRRRAREQKSPYIRTVARCQGGPNPLSFKSTDRIRGVPAQISRASSEYTGRTACCVNLV
ncbi:hypothetical protein MRX96_054629 [Rhipicephalus microplus]